MSMSSVWGLPVAKTMVSRRELSSRAGCQFCARSRRYCSLSSIVPSGRATVEAGSRLSGKSSGGSGAPEDTEAGAGSAWGGGSGETGGEGGAAGTAAAGRLPCLAVTYHVLRTFLASSVRLVRVVPCWIRESR